MVRKSSRRSAARLVPALAVLGVLVASCGVASGSEQPSESVRHQSSASAQESRLDMVEPTVGGLLPVVAGQPPGLIVIPWQLNRADALTTQVYLTVTGVGCSVPKAVKVQQLPDRITITAYGTGPVEPCTGRRVVFYGYVATAAPIAGRRVIHGR